MGKRPMGGERGHAPLHHHEGQKSPWRGRQGLTESSHLTRCGRVLSRDSGTRRDPRVERTQKAWGTERKGGGYCGKWGPLRWGGRTRSQGLSGRLCRAMMRCWVPLKHLYALEMYAKRSLDSYRAGIWGLHLLLVSGRPLTHCSVTKAHVWVIRTVRLVCIETWVQLTTQPGFVVPFAGSRK